MIIELAVRRTRRMPEGSLANRNAIIRRASHRDRSSPAAGGRGEIAAAIGREQEILQSIQHGLGTIDHDEVACLRDCLE